jgi:hypothetical protein
MAWPDHILIKTVTGSYKNSSGTAAKGRVTFTPTTNVIDENNLVIASDTVSAALNANGSFSIDLPATDNPKLVPSDWAYIVNVRLYGVKPLKYYVKLPYGDGQPVDIIESIISPTSPLQDASSQGSGIRGPAGPRGAGIITGEGPPSDLIGLNDDVYIDTETSSYYGPKANGSWPTTPFYSAGQTTRYVFNQASPSSTWNISHVLGGKPSVTVVDSSGTVVVGEVTYNSNTSVTVSFSAPFSGSAYLT